mgnify:CR=1 FL=1|tara:strand:- start:12071 stop:17836 length:5766 start_codon:yes stop_codon:yes gene_type:complete
MAKKKNKINLEHKNNFIKSRMNKDLDSRLIPPGEYRDAKNVMISTSEGDDVGALENVLKNESIVSLFPPRQVNNAIGCKIIGYIFDQNKNRLIAFLTNWTDNSFDKLSAKPKPVANLVNQTSCYISVYDFNTSVSTIICEGLFLNFSLNSPINDVSILEDLLFWTDNRNQPRKINVRRALEDPTYYDSEDKISVCKYYPYNAIRLYDLDTIRPQNSVSTMINKSDEYIVEDPLDAADYISNPNYDENWEGDSDYLDDKFLRFSYRFKFDDNEYSLMAPFTQIAFIPKQYGFLVGNHTNAEFTSSEQEDQSYRSTILKQMENFVDQATLNIDLPFAANEIREKLNITEIEILSKRADEPSVKVVDTIPVETLSNNSTNTYSYVYKSTAPYETLPEAEIIRVYDKAPIRAKTLAITGNRVIYGNYVSRNKWPDYINYHAGYDQKLTPLNQSTSFASVEYPSHSLKHNRTYQVGIVLADRYGRQSPVILSKNDFDNVDITNFPNFGDSTFYVNYRSGDPNRQNILNWPGDSIQLLFDDVIDLENNGGIYRTNGEPKSFISGTTTVGVGEEIQDLNTIGQDYSATVPTVPLNITTGSGTGMTILYTLQDNPTIPGKEIDTVTVVEGGSGYSINDLIEVPDAGSSGGAFQPATFRIADVYAENPLGWYTYKVVVKQQEQEYYNVYLPGVMAGFPKPTPSTVDEEKLSEKYKTSFTTLHNDNINKIPRDLKEVGPDDQQFRSSVKLFPRVENFLNFNVWNATPGTNTWYNYYYSRQFQLKNKYSTTDLPLSVRGNVVSDFSNDIQTNLEMELKSTVLANFGSQDKELIQSGDIYNGWYRAETDPLTVRISTKRGEDVQSNPNTMGEQAYAENAAGDEFTWIPRLAIYETEPFESKLDIYWETSTSGLITELNKDIEEGDQIAVDFSETGATTNWTEATYVEPHNNTGSYNGTPGAMTDPFHVRNFSGAQITGTYSLISANSQSGQSAVVQTVTAIPTNPFDRNGIDFFMLTGQGTGNEIVIYDNRRSFYGNNSLSDQVWDFYIRFTTTAGVVSEPVLRLAMDNVIPSLTVVNPTSTGQYLEPGGARWDGGQGNLDLTPTALGPWIYTREQDKEVNGSLEDGLIGIFEYTNGSGTKQVTQNTQGGQSVPFDQMECQFIIEAVERYAREDDLSNYFFVELQVDPSNTERRRVHLKYRPARLGDASRPALISNREYYIRLTIKDANGLGGFDTEFIYFNYEAPRINKASGLQGNVETIDYPSREGIPQLLRMAKDQIINFNDRTSTGNVTRTSEASQLLVTDRAPTPGGNIKYQYTFAGQTIPTGYKRHPLLDTKEGWKNENNAPYGTFYPTSWKSAVGGKWRVDWSDEPYNQTSSSGQGNHQFLGSSNSFFLDIFERNSSGSALEFYGSQEAHLFRIKKNVSDLTGGSDNTECWRWNNKIQEANYSGVYEYHKKGEFALTFWAAATNNGNSRIHRLQSQHAILVEHSVDGENWTSALDKNGLDHRYILTGAYSGEPNYSSSKTIQPPSAGQIDDQGTQVDYATAKPYSQPLGGNDNAVKRASLRCGINFLDNPTTFGPQSGSFDANDNVPTDEKNTGSISTGGRLWIDDDPDTLPDSYSGANDHNRFDATQKRNVTIRLAGDNTLDEVDPSDYARVSQSIVFSTPGYYRISRSISTISTVASSDKEWKKYYGGNSSGYSYNLRWRQRPTSWISTCDYSYYSVDINDVNNPKFYSYYVMDFTWPLWPGGSAGTAQSWAKYVSLQGMDGTGASGLDITDPSQTRTLKLYAREGLCRYVTQFYEQKPNQDPDSQWTAKVYDRWAPSEVSSSQFYWPDADDTIKRIVYRPATDSNGDIEPSTSYDRKSFGHDNAWGPYIPSQSNYYRYNVYVGCISPVDRPSPFVFGETFKAGQLDPKRNYPFRAGDWDDQMT